MVHDADMLHWYTNKEIISGQGLLLKNSLEEVPDFYDNAIVQVLLEGQITATLKSDWLMPEALQSWGDGRIFVTGTKGRVEIRTSGDAEGPYITLTTHKTPMRRLAAAKPEVGLAADFINRIQGKPHSLTMQDIYRCSATVLKMDAATTCVTKV